MLIRLKSETDENGKWYGSNKKIKFHQQEDLYVVNRAAKVSVFFTDEVVRQLVGFIILLTHTLLSIRLLVTFFSLSGCCATHIRGYCFFVPLTQLIILCHAR